MDGPQTSTEAVSAFLPENSVQSPYSPWITKELIRTFAQNVAAAYEPKEGDPFIFEGQQRILDKSNRITSMLDKHPDDPVWENDPNTLVKNFIKSTRSEFPEEELSHRRTIQQIWKNTLKEYEGTLDPLTGIGNRKAVLRHLKRLTEYFGRHPESDNAFAICYIDLNNFKNLNDILGHGAGDEVLKAVARLLQEKTREESDSVARLGGDEFVIIFDNLNTNVRALLRKLHDLQPIIGKVTNQLNPSNRQVKPLSLSAGILFVDKETIKLFGSDDQVAALLNTSDKILSFAKLEFHKNPNGDNNILGVDGEENVKKAINSHRAPITKTRH